MGFYNALKQMTCLNHVSVACVHVGIHTETSAEQMVAEYSHLTCTGT